MTCVCSTLLQNACNFGCDVLEFRSCRASEDLALKSVCKRNFSRIEIAEWSGYVFLLRCVKRPLMDSRDLLLAVDLIAKISSSPEHDCRNDIKPVAWRAQDRMESQHMSFSAPAGL